MAKFNEEIFNIDVLLDKEKANAGVYLQALLPAEELAKLKEDWHAAGGYKKIPRWKFALENISVGYSADIEKERQTEEKEMLSSETDCERDL